VDVPDDLSRGLPDVDPDVVPVGFELRIQEPFYVADEAVERQQFVLGNVEIRAVMTARNNQGVTRVNRVFVIYRKGQLVFRDDRLFRQTAKEAFLQ
jgi:hypothetical protein